jgi:uncharacterized membrane protein
MPETRPERRSPRLLGLFFVFAGTMHFVIPKFYARIMPPWIPAHAEMVALSGVAEIAGGAAALHPRTRRLAGSWLVATMIAVFPANVHAAVNPEECGAEDVPSALMWARLPGQWLFIRWILDATRPAR